MVDGGAFNNKIDYVKMGGFCLLVELHLWRVCYQRGTLSRFYYIYFFKVLVFDFFFYIILEIMMLMMLLMGTTTTKTTIKTIPFFLFVNICKYPHISGGCVVSHMWDFL